MEEAREHSPLSAPRSRLSTIGAWHASQFEVARGGASHNPVLDGMRGCAVLLVFFVHYATAVRAWLPDGGAITTLALSVKSLGNTGVDLFFVISGYLIYQHLIQKETPYLKFMARRVRRIYPTFLVVFVLYLVLSLAFPARSKLPAELGERIEYLIANILLLPGLFPIVPMITVAWSLSYEMAFYLVMPWIVAGLQLRRINPRWRLLGIAALSLLIIVTGLFGEHNRMAMFFAGMLVSEMRAAAIKMRLADLSVAVGCLLVFASKIASIEDTAVGDARLLMMFIGFFLASAAVLTADARWLDRFLCARWLRWLGGMSYSFYLIHGVTLLFLFEVLLVRIFPPGGAQPYVFFVALLPAFACAWIVSMALYLAVERPMSLLR